MPTSSALVRWVFLPDFIHFFIYVLQALDPNIKTAYAKEKWEAVFYKAGCKRLEAVVSQFCCLLVLPVLTMSSLIPIMSLLLLCRLRMCKVLHQVSLCFYCPDFNLKLHYFFQAPEELRWPATTITGPNDASGVVWALGMFFFLRPTK